MTIKIDTRIFKRRAAKLLQYSKKEPKVFMTQQAKLYVKEVQLLHPPGDESTKGTAAKQKGEMAIENDLRRAFTGVENLDQSNIKDIDREHQSLRNSRGRVKKGLRKKRYVKQSVLNSLIVRTKKKVGSLAAGLNMAAGRLGTKPPAWIWKHKSPGRYSVKVSSRGVRIRITNAVPWASSVKGLPHHFHRALRTRNHKMKRHFDSFVKKMAKKSGFKKVR